MTFDHGKFVVRKCDNVKFGASVWKEFRIYMNQSTKSSKNAEDHMKDVLNVRYDTKTWPGISLTIADKLLDTFSLYNDVAPTRLSDERALKSCLRMQ